MQNSTNILESLRMTNQNELNAQQKLAVETTEGPLLVLAGAGTGKTKVLTHRIAHILTQNLAYPNEILAVTFTNKAAGEMKNRISELMNHPVEGWWIGTFHSLSAKICRQYAEHLGLTPYFTILDMDDQLKLIKQLIQAEGYDEKQVPPRNIRNIIQRWKDRGLNPHQVTSGEQSNLYGGKALILYEHYQQRLKILNAMDFGELLLACLNLFSQHHHIISQLQTKFKYILVDEYQDTNIAQYLWLRFLAKNKQNAAINICCVGDEDQSIYGWRGAEIGNILKFEKDFSGSTIIRLEQNYRSTPQIIQAAATLISNNKNRLGKTLWTAHQAGDNLKIISVWDGEDEARTVNDEIESLQRQKQTLSSMAVLVRAGFQTRAFEERFLKTGTPYKVIGGLRFYERQEIRDALAYFRLIIQPHDDLALERIINIPKRGIGKTTIQKLHIYAREHQLSLFQTIGHLTSTNELGAKAKKSLFDFIQYIERWRKMLTTDAHDQVAKQVLEDSGYVAMWQQANNTDSASRLENLKELILAIKDFETLPALLEHVSLIMEKEDASQDDMVSIMTLHAAKGLEFETVFLPGWEEGLFPHQKSLSEQGTQGLEEERRLAYVGLTRARQRVFITHAMRRNLFYQWQDCFPSRFIEELCTNTQNISQLKMTPKFQHQDSYGASGQSSFQGHNTSSRFAFNESSISGNEAQTRYKKTINTASIAYPKQTLHERVYHPKFGYGTAISKEGDKVTVIFDEGDTKKLYKKFLQSG